MTQLEIVNHHLATHGRITPLEAYFQQLLPFMNIKSLVCEMTMNIEY